MLDRGHIQRLLHINGVTADSSEEDITFVLKSARFSDQEITEAINILNNVTTSTDDVKASAAKLVRTDKSLSPQEISRLLGIEVQVSTHQTDAQMLRVRITRLIEVTQQFALIVGAVALGFIGIFGAMYLFEVGVFHPTAALLPYAD